MDLFCYLATGELRILNVRVPYPTTTVACRSMIIRARQRAQRVRHPQYTRRRVMHGPASFDGLVFVSSDIVESSRSGSS